MSAGEMGGGEFYHLARPDEQHLLFGDVGKNALGKAHGRRRHRDHVGTDRSVAAHLLGHRKRALKELREQATQGPGGLRCAHRILHLAEDLRLTEHHRFEACGNAKRVPDRVALGEGVHVGLEIAGVHGMVVGQPVQRLTRFARGAVKLGAVAGRQDRSLPDRHSVDEFGQRRLRPLGGKGHPLAHRNRCGLVVDS